MNYKPDTNLTAYVPLIDSEKEFQSFGIYILKNFNTSYKLWQLGNNYSIRYLNQPKHSSFKIKANMRGNAKLSIK